MLLRDTIGEGVRLGPINSMRSPRCPSASNRCPKGNKRTNSDLSFHVRPYFVPFLVPCIHLALTKTCIQQHEKPKRLVSCHLFVLTSLPLFSGSRPDFLVIPLLDRSFPTLCAVSYFLHMETGYKNKSLMFVFCGVSLPISSHKNHIHKPVYLGIIFCLCRSPTNHPSQHVPAKSSANGPHRDVVQP